MVHAGLPAAVEPRHRPWPARGEVEQVRSGTVWHDYFAHMYGNKPNGWDESLHGIDRWRFITNCLTRLRFCRPTAAWRWEKGPPGSQMRRRCLVRPPAALLRPAHRVQPLVDAQATSRPTNVWALDTGCLWGAH